MVDPGSVGDWLQASLIAAALGGLAAVGRWALREEEADRTTRMRDPWARSASATMSLGGKSQKGSRQLGGEARISRGCGR